MATSWINTVWERERNTKWVRSISQLRNRANGWAKKRYHQQLCCLLICTHDINAHCRRCCRRHRCCCQHCPVNSLFIEMVFNEFVSFFGTISLLYADIHANSIHQTIPFSNSTTFLWNFDVLFVLLKDNK